jgi:protein-disulfide isomerase
MLEPLDEQVDHVRGEADAPVILEYGDYECPYSRQAFRGIERVERELPGRVRFAFRHFPLTEIHPHARAASTAAEAAARQGRFWEMHDLLLEHQDALEPDDLVRYAQQIGLDAEQFASDLSTHDGAGRVADDVDSADLSGVSGTPTFFVNGQRHYGAYDLETLSNTVRLAGARAVFAGS